MIVPRRKGISPVIATVIIVAVTIAVAIAVAFWMTGIIGLFTGAVEKLEITSANAVANIDQQGGNLQGWTITLTVRNTGTTSTSITDIFVNNYPAFSTQQQNLLDCVDAPQEQQLQLPITITPGQTVNIQFIITSGACNYQNNNVFTADSGVSIEVKLHTSGGKDYPKLLVLP
jgi:flagellin-like protein